jgi:amidase
MAANVRDAVLLLAAMTGPDSQDPASPAAAERFGIDYAAALDANGLRGKRIGVVRSLAGFHEGVDAQLEQGIADLVAGGAEIVDDLSFTGAPGTLEDDAYELLLYEFKHGLNAYLAALPGPERQLRLADLIEFNRRQRDTEMQWFQQEIFLEAEQKGSLEESAYRDLRQRVGDYSRQAIDRLLATDRLDLLVSPSNTPAWVIDLVVGDRWLGGSSSMPARAGYPHLTVPMGYVHGLPVGLSFYGTAHAEATLIEAGYAYEQISRHARPPEGYRAWRPAARAE